MSAVVKREGGKNFEIQREKKKNWNLLISFFSLKCRRFVDFVFIEKSTEILFFF